VLKTLSLSLMAIAALAASLLVGAPQGRAAADDAPWCILDYEGHPRCYYASSQACLAEIASGNRGFCIQNSAGSSATAAEPEPSRTKPSRTKTRRVTPR
jgi:hypothetical protein